MADLLFPFLCGLLKKHPWHLRDVREHGIHHHILLNILFIHRLLIAAAKQVPNFGTDARVKRFMKEMHKGDPFSLALDALLYTEKGFSPLVVVAPQSLIEADDLKKTVRKASKKCSETRACIVCKVEGTKEKRLWVCSKCKIQLYCSEGIFLSLL
jgi:hypothetical protein